MLSFVKNTGIRKYLKRQISSRKISGINKGPNSKSKDPVLQLLSKHVLISMTKRQKSQPAVYFHSIWPNDIFPFSFCRTSRKKKCKSFLHLYENTARGGPIPCCLRRINQNLGWDLNFELFLVYEH